MVRLRRTKEIGLSVLLLDSADLMMLRPTEFADETNDCAVFALSSLLDCSYEMAHEALRIAGRIRRQGFKLRPYMNERTEIFGFNIRPVHPLAYCPLRTVVANYPLGRFLCVVPRHCTAIIDGKVFDHKPSHYLECRMEDVWRFYRSDEVSKI